MVAVMAEAAICPRRAKKVRYPRHGFLYLIVLVIDVQAAHRCNDVRFDVVLDTLLGQGHGKSDQAG